jgi:hypothetical protein
MGGDDMITLTLEDYFGRMSRVGEAPPEDVRTNSMELLRRVNALLDDPALEPIEAAGDKHVNSGWRPAWYNAQIATAAPKSKHITGEAIDIADPDGELDDYLFTAEGRELLDKYGLWMEHPLSTKGWCHLQSVAPRSGNRVFIP